MTAPSTPYDSLMAALADRLRPAGGAREDHYVRLRGAVWSDYERLLSLRGESAVPRITYLEGDLEVMSPSLAHESIRSTIGRLVEVWCLAHGVEFSAAGSWTLKDEHQEAGAEPDECYVFGPIAGRTRPDLAIEIAWSRDNLDKLHVYSRLRIPEVWYFRRGRIEVFVLRGARYTQAERSHALPALDFEHLAGFLSRDTTSEAIRDYHAALTEAE